MAKTVLELKNVNKTFGKRKVIDNISLDVKEGEYRLLTEKEINSLIKK